VDRQSKNIQTVVITGMSGSGKSTALRAFEDMGYYCLDNLPITLLPDFLSLAEKSSEIPPKIAMVMDLRERGFLDQYASIFNQIKGAGYHLELLFLDTSDDVLVQRFSQTRRRHPLQHKENTPISEAIAEERKRLRGIREFADKYIDTSGYNVHQLREAVLTLYSQRQDLNRLLIHVISFGFKYGLPADANLVFDVRFLTNPYFEPELRPLSGCDAPVKDYVMRDKETSRFLAHLEQMLGFLVPNYQREGKSYLVVAVGCTGGRHRSVAIAEWIRDFFRQRGHDVVITHRDLEKEG
jgi:UPF0042 nucleotide-binding protein